MTRLSTSACRCLSRRVLAFLLVRNLERTPSGLQRGAPTSSAWAFPWLPVLANTSLSLSSYTGSSRDVSGFSLWFHTYILRRLSGMRISSLAKCEFKPSLPEYWLHIFWFQVRGQVRTWQISSYLLPVCVSPFYLLYSVFQRPFFFFFSMPWASCVLSKNSFPNPRSKGFAPRFYSSNFMVVCFTFGSTMHCEWFLHMVLGTSRGCSIFIRPSQSSQCFSTIFEKNTFPQPLI